MEEKNKENIKNEKEEVLGKEEKRELKKGFFKKLWYSITKIEKYPDMAAEGFARTIMYLTKIVAILAVVICLGIIYQTYGILQEGVQYLKNEFPEFTYEDGIFNVENEEPIIISEKDSYVGKVIIDTDVTEETEINKYINDIQEEGDGIIVLNDKIIIKDEAVAGTINYNFKEILEPMGIQKVVKQDVISYINSTQIISIFISLFFTMFIYAFTIYLLTTISNVVLLSFFGYIATILAKIRMRYVAIFNMAVYALTLSILLNTVYIGINIFIPFEMKYFQVMYTTVAVIYLVAAILILKTEFMKKELELRKIIEQQELLKQEKLDEEQQEKERKEKEERKKKDKEKESDEGEEPEGSKA